MEESAVKIDQEAVITLLSAKDNECDIQKSDCTEQNERKENEQKDIDPENELSPAISNPHTQTDGTPGCEENDIRDRPTSLRLESVLEYTSKIKSFLGLKDEAEELALNLPPDPNWKRLPSGLDPAKTDESDEIPSTVELEVEERKRDVAENKITEDVSETNQKKVILDSDENTNVDAEKNSSTTSENYLFPDIVKITGSSPKNNSEDNAPDVVKANNSGIIPCAENIPIVVTDICDVMTVGPVGEKINIFSLNEANVKDMKDPTDDKTELSANNIVISQNEGQIDRDLLQDVNDNNVPEVIDDGGSENEDSCSLLVSIDSLPQFVSLEEDMAEFDQNGMLELQDCETDQPGGSQNSEVEDTYQVIHIEEGLRKVEKETLQCDQSKDSNVNKTTDSDITALKRKSSHIEDIRRLSCEVVSFVLQSAGEEVKHILRERNSFQETDHSRNTNEESSSVKQLLDTKLEDHENAEVLKDNFLMRSDNKQFTSISEEHIEMDNLNSYSEKVSSRKQSESDLECGFGGFRPRCLQRFATSRAYLVLYSVIGILHGSYYTYLVGVLSTLEKRFSFKSKTSGLIMILDELTPLFLGVLVGHFANRVHRPRLVSFGMFLSAFCCFASALPYFLYGTASHLTSTAVHNRTGVEVCEAYPRTELCDTDDRPPTVTAIILLMLGSFLKGFGNLAYYAIGLAYLDDNAKKKNTPLYFAVAFALRLLGPMVGFLMSSAFLKYYENPLDDPGFGPEDPRWIGGWWMGFVLQGILLMIFAGPLAFFPRSLPGHKQMETTTSGLLDVSGLMDALKRLARNRLYILININTVLVIYGNFGYYILSPKYMENQFRLTASSASLFAGPPGIAAFMISTVIGGYLIWRFKPNAKLLAGGLVCVEVIATVGYLLLMIPQCETVNMSHFGHGKDSLVLEGGCNAGCHCSTMSFTPVCGPGGETYFNPCYAGCRSHSHNQTYSECSCVDAPLQEVKRGLCFSDNCTSQAIAYILTLPVLQFFISSLRVANTMILLRCIQPEDKNIALGVFETILSTVAFIPFPILFGALIDSTCLVWEKSCGETGNCWFYDIQKFNYFIHGASALFCGLSVFTLIAIYCNIHRIGGDLYEEEEGTTDSNTEEVSVKL